jgi:transposase
MNVQVHRAVSDLTGKTGMSIIRSIVAGERDPNKLAAYRDSRCQKSEKTIAEHLTGNWREEHLFNLGMALRFYDELQEAITCYEKRLSSSHPGNCNLLKINKKYVVLLKKNGAFSNKL